MAGTAHAAFVVEVTDGGFQAMVTVPTLADETMQFGPCQVYGNPVAVGDRVVAINLESVLEDLVVVGGAFGAVNLILDDLANVNDAAHSDGDTLVWKNDVQAWSSEPLLMGQLGDVNTTGVAVNDILFWTGTEWQPGQIFENMDLTDLGDVTVSGPAAGQTLRYDGDEWVNTLLGFDDLSDVLLTGPIGNPSVLRYNGTNWVNVTNLELSGYFRGTRTTNTQGSFAATMSGDTNDRWTAYCDGVLKWGDGTNAQDVNLYRLVTGSVAQLATDNVFRVVRSSAGTAAIRTAVDTDTDARWAVEAGGEMWWGPGGVTTQDVNLYRSAAGVLKTDYTFQANNTGWGVLTQASTTSASAAIGTTATVVMQTSSVTFKANRAYSIEIETGVNGNTAHANAHFRIYKGTTTATEIFEYYRIGVGGTTGASGTQNASLSRVITIGGADVTTAIALGIVASTGTISLFASSVTPSVLRVVDVGPASAYSGSPVMP